MAKNNYLFRFFLCLIASLCIGIGSVVIKNREAPDLHSLDDNLHSLDNDSRCLYALDLRSLRWPHVVGTSSVSLNSTSDLISGKSVISCTSVFKNGTSVSINNTPFPLNIQPKKTPTNENIIRNKLKQIYSAEIGVREKTGKNDGERVEEYLAVTNLGKGYAWCAAFVSWVFSEAGFPVPRTPWSPALFPKKRVIWERGREVMRADNLVNRTADLNSKLTSPHTDHLSSHTRFLTPKSADVFGIYFANLKRIAHVGFVDEWGEKQIITVEGNTNEAGSVEGDGVYRKRRPIASIYQVANWIDLEGEP